MGDNLTGTVSKEDVINAISEFLKEEQEKIMGVGSAVITDDLMVGSDLFPGLQFSLADTLDSSLSEMSRLLDLIEAKFGISLSQEERENSSTIADIIALVTSRG